MDRFDRIFDLHKLLSGSRRPVSRQRIEQQLECSRATAKRIIEAMRNYLNAPIQYDREQNGYYYDQQAAEPMYELPGIWFNSSELYALMSMQQLLSDVQPGLLEQQLAPLKSRIGELLKVQHAGGDSLDQRIKILRAGARPAGASFTAITQALARQQRLNIAYYQRSKDIITSRLISPQRLIYYRDNWYLDAYCHLRQALRTFSLDAIRSAAATSEKSLPIAAEVLDQHQDGAYGIFAGAGEQMAILKFAPHRARWVADEQWHPKQQGQWLEDGAYQLSIPYSNPAELLMDILKYAADVEVMAPAGLRATVKQQLEQARQLYQ